MTKVREIIKHPKLIEFYDFWNALRGGKEVPERIFFDPMELPPEILPNLVLFEAREEPIRIYVRLVGTRVIEHFGEDSTGKYLDEVDMGDYTAKSIARFTNMVSNRQPNYIVSEYEKEDGRKLQIESLAVPFSLDGRTVKQMLSCAYYTMLNSLGEPLLVESPMSGKDRG